MLERDADGFIIGKLPESAKPYKNLSYLVVPEAGGLSEYTPDAYNRVNTFFRNLLHRSLLNLQIRCVKNLNPPSPKNIKII